MIKVIAKETLQASEDQRYFPVPQVTQDKMYKAEVLYDYIPHAITSKVHFLIYDDRGVWVQCSPNIFKPEGVE